MLPDNRQTHEADGSGTVIRSARYRWWFFGVAVVVIVTVGLALTQPWLAFIDTTVNEDFPAPDGAAAATDTSPGTISDTSIPAPLPQVLARGAFVSIDKDAAGEASVYQLDGSRVLRLADFTTTNGPDVFIVLSPHPADAGNDVLGQGYISLGRMKGNVGNQNYDIPADVDLTQVRSVVVWCERFVSAFGAADLSPAR
jgi:hypothetical protein